MIHKKEKEPTGPLKHHFGTKNIRKTILSSLRRLNKNSYTSYTEKVAIRVAKSVCLSEDAKKGLFDIHVKNTIPKNSMAIFRQYQSQVPSAI